jgi:hypothetical protein
VLRAIRVEIGHTDEFHVGQRLHRGHVVLADVPGADHAGPEACLGSRFVRHVSLLSGSRRLAPAGYLAYGTVDFRDARRPALVRHRAGALLAQLGRVTGERDLH